MKDDDKNNNNNNNGKASGKAEQQRAESSQPQARASLPQQHAEDADGTTPSPAASDVTSGELCTSSTSSVQSVGVSQASTTSSSASSYPPNTARRQQQQQQQNQLQNGQSQADILSLLQALVSAADPNSQVVGNNLKIPSVADVLAAQKQQSPDHENGKESPTLSEQQLDTIKMQLQTLLGGGPPNSSSVSSTEDTTSGNDSSSSSETASADASSNGLPTDLSDQISLIAGIIVGLQEKNLEAAVLGARIFLSNPEAAAQVLSVNGASAKFPAAPSQVSDSVGTDTSSQDNSRSNGASLQQHQHQGKAAGHKSSSTTNHKHHHHFQHQHQQLVSSGSSRLPMLMYTPADDELLSRYQCFIRQQMELFEAAAEDVKFNISRMNKVIVLGQVGMRCRHCAVLPPYSRPKASIYFPRTLDSMYQIGQDMVKNHLRTCCELIPAEIKKQLLSLQEESKRSRSGRDRWAESAQQMGVIEDENGLRFT